MAKLKSLFPILFILFLSFQNSLNAQRPDLSGLKEEILNAKSEKERLEGIINIASTYSNLRSDSADYYLELLNNEEFANSEVADAGKNFIEGIKLYRSRKFEEAIVLLEKSAKVFENSVSDNIYLNNLNTLGISYLRLRRENDGILVFKKLIERASKNEDGNYLASSYANMSNGYKNLGNFAEAIFYSEKSIAFSSSSRIKGSATIAYMNMAQMLSRLELFERSIEIYDLALSQGLENDQVTLSMLSGKAKAFQRFGKLDSAIVYFEKAIRIGIKNDLDNLLLSPHIELATIYLEKEQYNRADEFVTKALSYCVQRCSPQARIQLLIIRIQIAQGQSNYEEAILLSNEFEQMINQQQMGHLSKEGFQIIASIYEEIGDVDNGLKYQKIYNELNFGSIALATKARLAEERNKLEVLESEAALVEEQSNSAFYKSISFQTAIISILLIIGLLVVFKYYRKERQERSLRDDELEILKEQLSQLSNLKSDISLEFITLKSKAVINLEKLKYIQSDGPYIELFLLERQNPEIDRNTLKHILVELPPHRFLQVHRSTIVNLAHIKAVFSNKLILKDGKELSISRSFKSEVESLLKASA
jgi:tetratricopeptide (TPR) repeat protein